jgi:hypothetical protein
MIKRKLVIASCSFLAMLGLATLLISPSHAKDLNAPAGVPVTMTVTASVDKGKRLPAIQQEDVVVKKGSARLEVRDWVPAQGDRAGLDLFILIDDASDTNLGTKLGELRSFINAQPATTSIGIGYARNATVQIIQNFTTEHAQAANALRLPIGSAGAYGSPYLSVVDLIKRWPQSQNRREVILVGDGIDRARRGVNALTNPDVDTAKDVAQRAGVMIHTIYSPGVGYWHRNFWQATNGENGLARLSEATGGESFFLGRQNPVSFAPYLDELQKTLDNQYFLTMLVKPDKKAALQYVNVSTEVAGVDLNSADAVWAPAAK